MAGKLRTILKFGGALVALVVVAAAGFFFWAKSASETRLAQKFETHKVDFPVPFPLTEQELEELRAEKKAALPPVDPAAAPAEGAAPADVLAGVDLNAIALERAVARGKYYVTTRYVCQECHGKDFAGGTMINDPAVGELFGPNLTGGKGSRQATFTIADWDRSVRHGVRPDGTPAIMPSTDFAAMSDRELSDIIAFIRSQPKVDKEMAPRKLGPLLTVLTALGQVRPSAEDIGHAKAHVAEPPPVTDTLAFGKHLAQACTGCHNGEFTGGPISGAPPDWAPAANLTQKGAGSWKYEDFEKVLRTGVKPDGTNVKVPMTLAVPATKEMKEEEVKALYAFFSSLPPKEPKH